MAEVIPSSHRHAAPKAVWARFLPLRKVDFLYYSRWNTKAPRADVENGYTPPPVADSEYRRWSRRNSTGVAGSMPGSLWGRDGRQGAWAIHDLRANFGVGLRPWRLRVAGDHRITSAKGSDCEKRDDGWPNGSESDFVRGTKAGPGWARRAHPGRTECGLGGRSAEVENGTTSGEICAKAAWNAGGMMGIQLVTSKLGLACRICARCPRKTVQRFRFRANEKSWPTWLTAMDVGDSTLQKRGAGDFSCPLKRPVSITWAVRLWGAGEHRFSPQVGKIR